MTWCFEASIPLPKGQLSFVERWPLMNPNEMIFILGTYLIFVLGAGAALMSGRPAFQIRPLLVFFNAFKLFNSVILGNSLYAYIKDKGLFPSRCDHDEITSYIIAMLYWKFMATKVLDLLDTVFFVLRKKTSQITFLHVYFRVFMVFVTWLSLKYNPSDHWAFMALTNCFVHSLMYLYYGISAMGPRYLKNVWWKKYLTVLQMIQIVAAIGHIVLQTNTSECPIRTSFYWIALSNVPLFVFLFTDFYNKDTANIQTQLKP